MNLKGYFTYIFSILFFLFILVPYSSGQQKGSINIRNYTPIEYLSHSQNWAIIQDMNGIMYFGNSAGILEFDGVRWQTIELSNKALGRSLDINNAGRIYVGGVGDIGFLKPNDKGEIIFQTLTNLLSEKDRDFQDVWYTHCSGEKVYFITNNKVFVYADGEINVLNKNYYFGPTFSIGNRTFVNSWDKGLQQIVADTLSDIPNGDFFIGKAVSFINLITDSKVVVGTMNSGVFTFEINNDKSLSEISNIKKFTIGTGDILDNSTIYCGDVSENGDIAIGTLTKGVFVVNQNGDILRRVDNGLRNKLIWNVFFDKESTLWLATNNGISKTDIESPIVFWDNNAGISSPVDNIISFNDTLFFAGFGGVRYIHDNQVDFVSNLKTECYFLFDFKIPNTNSNILLASTLDNGIVEIKGLKFEKVINVVSWSLLQSSSDSSLLYIASDKGLFIAKYDNSKWAILGRVEGINDNIRDIQQDKNGNIWLCTFLNGVIRIIPSMDILKPKDIIYYGLEEGLPALTELEIEVFEGEMIFLTSNGLFHFNEKTSLFEPDDIFGKEYCNSSQSITEIVIDGKQQAWIAGVKNKKDWIIVFNQDEKGKYVEIESYALSLLPPMSIGKIFVDNQNTVWIGSSEGLYKFSGDVNKSSKAFKTLIRSVITEADTLFPATFNLNNNSIVGKSLTENLQITYNHNSVLFQFAAPNFSQEESTLYQTWLQGFKGGWSVWSTDTKKEYINLSEGNYIFHVRSKNIFNVLGEEATFEFTIEPPIYRTFWAFILYFLILVSIVILVVFLNGKRLILVNRKLERIVEERTNKIVIQKEELQSQSENLQVLNEELKQRNNEIEEQHGKLVDLNATKNRFFNIIAHDLRSPFQSLIGLSDLLSTDADNFTEDDIREFNSAIRESAQSGFALLENLLEWARTQTSHIDFNPQKISLNYIIEDNFQINRGAATNKKIELKSNIINDVFLFADSNMLNTVFRNLISNAIKFTPQNGSVTVSAHENNNLLILSIEDNGVGIEKSDIDKLFRIDTKFSTTGTANETGTGLGLLLCKEFVEKNEGTISVESTIGKGSKFILSFPAFKE